ncbi:MAG: aminotransferase class V-fold PLP-dependent enzyme [Actinomycetes bacterium]
MTSVLARSLNLDARSAADRPLLPVAGADLPVPLVDGRVVPYANLDYAASAPALECVAQHVAQVLPYYASVHRGAGYASRVSTALYEGARVSVGRFLDVREDDVVVFTRNTTDSLNLLAGCVPPGGRVLLLDLEHHANLLPWQQVEHDVLPVASTLEETLTDVSRALAQRPTALLAVTGASNVTGEELPVDLLVTIAHAHGARVVVDAAQLAPHRRISLQESGVDYLAFSGHKLYAPYGSGVLVGRRDWLDAGRPHLAGGGAVRSVAVDSTEWAAAPQRHEAGSPNVLGATAIAAACEALATLPEGALEVHETVLRDRLVGGLSAIDGVHVHRIWPDSQSSIGVVTFSVDGYDPGLVAAELSAEHGIGVRDGKFCAHPLLARLGLPEGAVRASVGVGTTATDVDRLVAAVRALLADGPGARYEVREGRWVPVDDPRELPSSLWGLLQGATSSGTSPCAQR